MQQQQNQIAALPHAATSVAEYIKMFRKQLVKAGWKTDLVKVLPNRGSNTNIVLLLDASKVNELTAALSEYYSGVVIKTA